jgi:predicted PurR-regulated permease PerM
VKTKLASAAKPVAQLSIVATGAFLGTLVEICFALFTLFYLLRDNHAIGQAVMNAVPLDEKQSRDVFQRCQDIIQASVQGVIVIAALQGALGAVAFWVLGIGSWIVWGVIMFVMSLIPALGAFVVWGPAAIYLFATGHWIKALILIIWGGGVIGTIDNFLRPRLVGQKTGMHDLVIFFSVLGGLQVFGILGLFVGPVVVALALSIVEVFKEVSAGWRTAPTTIITDLSTPPTATQDEPIVHPMEIDPPRA